MASDESVNFISSSLPDDYYDRDDVTDDGFDHQPILHNLSRLSACTSSVYTNEEEEDDDDDLDCDGMRMFMSGLSLHSLDADEELSDGKDDRNMLDMFSDSDKEPGCYSLPVTPPRRRNLGGLMKQVAGAKDYSSENEAQKSMMRQKMRKNTRSWRIGRERGEDASNTNKKKDDQESIPASSYPSYCCSFSGESTESSGVVVVTRPKGGNRSLCMDLDEVKACIDLGFELEHERMLEMPAGRVSISGSTLDTSSGGNSPIANWRISGPGDDPRDVKARIKVWAQAVAIASASRHHGA